MKLRNLQIFAVSALALIAVSANAQVAMSKDGRPEMIYNPARELNSQDIHFLKEAGIINNFEMMISKLAVDKSSDPFITQYAKEMISDHQMSANEVKIVADGFNIALPQDLPADLKHTYMHLQNLNGADFDAAFLKVQKAGHADASNEFNAEIQNGKESSCKGYAVKTLPEIKMHYRMLLMKKTMMGTTKMNDNG